MALVVRAINYGMGLQDFTLILIVNFEQINHISSQLRATADNFQVAVAGLSARLKGILIVDLSGFTNFHVKR